MKERKEYLNEENYLKTNNKIKWIGRIMILIGIAIILVGVFIIKVPDMSSTDWYEADTKRNIFIFGGVFITIVGCILRFVVANQRNMMAYQLQQIMPLGQENMEKMAPYYGNVAKEVTKGVKEGLKEEKNKSK